MSRPIVAIVGRPNVGKSTLFNKLIGQRLSIVEDVPGVTRDRIFGECEWKTRKFSLVDTGGIEPESKDIILSQMREQAQIAIDSADVVLMNSKLTDVSGAVRLSRATIRNIHENLFWAFAYNALLIPMAAGLYPGIRLNPMYGAAAMALSSFTVCMNALRLNLVRVHDSSRDRVMRKRALPETEEKTGASGGGTETILIDGMMCEMCEKHISSALLSVDGITDVRADYKTGRAAVTYTEKPDEAAIKKAVEDADYGLTGILPGGTIN